MKTEQPAPQAVVITGTSTGIGRACALHLDNLGYRVFAGVRKVSDGAALQQVASARLTPVFIDVTDEASIAAAQDMVEREMGARGLFSLVNNAGYGLAAPIEYQPIADLRQLLEVNLIGAVAVTKAFIPLLRQGKGRIINIGSISGLERDAVPGWLLRHEVCPGGDQRLSAGGTATVGSLGLCRRTRQH